jgi:hypothetical protein
MGFTLLVDLLFVGDMEKITTDASIKKAAGNMGRQAHLSHAE